MTSLTVGKVGSAVYLPGAEIRSRVLQEFQLVWILRGSADWWFAGQTHEVRPGQLLLVPPGREDRWQWDRHEPTTHGYAYFRLAAHGAPDHGSGTWPLLRPMSHDDPLPATLRYLLRLDLTSEGDSASAADIVKFVLTLFVRGAAGHQPARLPAAVDAVVQHVYQAWTPSGVARPLALHELAAAASVSTGHLCRVFCHHFGVGPVTALELLRLARAATLLSESDVPTAAIARACGFADPDHFSHRFKRVYGQPPGRYRHACEALDPSAPLAAARLLPLASRLLG